MSKAIAHYTALEPLLTGDWEHPCWSSAETLAVDQFRPEGSDHRPTTQVRVLYSDTGLHLIFRVQDQYVRSVQTTLNSAVCRDSCVECFVQPRSDKGYFNFEVNCGGTLHASYIVDRTRTDAGFADFSRLRATEAEQIGIFHSMPKLVDPEIAEPTTWVNQLYIPFDVLTIYAGDLGAVRGQTWRANFYKCGDKTSHPHWAAWSPVRELNFHDPDCFGEIVFDATRKCPPPTGSWRPSRSRSSLPS